MSGLPPRIVVFSVVPGVGRGGLSPGPPPRSADRQPAARADELRRAREGGRADKEADLRAAPIDAVRSRAGWPEVHPYGASDELPEALTDAYRESVSGKLGV